MVDLILAKVKKSKLLIEQHIHGAYGVDFNTASSEDIVKLSKKLIKHGIGGFYPTLVADSVENIKRQIEEIKTAKNKIKADSAEILGIHIEGSFINPEKAGIQDKSFFFTPNIENYKLIEDDLIKIVTIAPELDEGLIKYLILKGVKVQAGHCIGDDLSNVHGITHLFNAMTSIHHRNTSTTLSALVNDDIYTEVIADGVHISDEAFKLVTKAKPKDKILLISDALPITNSTKKSMLFAGEKVYYDGVKATSKEGTLAGSTKLLNKIVQELMRKGYPAFNYIENQYKYLNVNLTGFVYWDNNFNIVAIEKNKTVMYKGV